VAPRPSLPLFPGYRGGHGSATCRSIRSTARRIDPRSRRFDPERLADLAGHALWFGCERAFAATAEGVTLDGALYRPARSMTGAALVSRWVDGAGSNVYMFDANGRFSFGTLGGGGLTGTYQLQGFALTLTFADGDTRRRTLFVASAGEPVGLISVEGEVYTRK
jgi:hypothetical protein